MLMRRHVFTLGIVTVFLLSFSSLAANQNCATCPLPVEVSGEFSHWKPEGAVVIQGASEREAAFQEEIFGSGFAIVVSQLPAGKYAIRIGEMETYFTEPKQRIFNVVVGDKIIAANYDIVASAGGPNKVSYITGEIEHRGDALRGPLAVKFTGVQNNAKFNTFEIKNSSGATVVSVKASDLSDALPNKPDAAKTGGTEIWKDDSKPIDARVNDLVSRLSLAEKVQQVRNDAPAIPRLGIPAFNYWNEALHGVARAGVATVFPQAIGMAATWDAQLVHAEADVISTEGRAKFHDSAKKNNGNSLQYFGLTYWSPNINIFRDPRWGRGQETYGEDTFLTGTMGVAFIRGIQGNDPNYLKAVACAKHFAVHSGPEFSRHRFDAEPSERDLYETYLPHFEMAVREGHVGGFMGAYNAIYGKPACANLFLLTDLLRKQWGFEGYIVSDCGAINDIRGLDKSARTPERAAAAAIQAGCDLCCGGEYNALAKAVEAGLVPEGEIDQALSYVLKTRFRLGLFDRQEKVLYSKIPISQNDTAEHEQLALRAARESIVLLKNDGVLPLNRQKLKRIAVIGANADDVPLLFGNYNGTNPRPVTVLAGVRAVAGRNVDIVYERGCPLVVKKDDLEKISAESFPRSIEAAKNSDVVIYIGGINASLEGEEGDGATEEGFRAGDRTRIELPIIQDELLKALHATGKPVIFVNCSGSAVAFPWEAENLPAIVQAWYPGEQGGRAVADILFGEANPGGRLPVTFYQSTADLPDFSDYSMSNRTYRYFSGKPLFAFGHGLSYTRFDYNQAKLKEAKLKADSSVKLSFSIKNSGEREGDEVAQVYFRHVNSAVPQPKLALCGFTRLHLDKGEKTGVTMDIPAKRFRFWDEKKKQYTVEPGDYELLIGSASDDIRCRLPFKIVLN
jgi:beta-glucosidase